jgi:hypothetical protein
MKRLVATIFLLVAVLFSASSCSSVMGDRFWGGLKQVASSPLQIRDNVREEMPKAQVAPIGATGGAIKGGFYMVKQVVTGIFTALTFFNTK